MSSPRTPMRWRGGADADRICREWSLAARPVDVMLTYLVALGLLERTGDAVRPTALAGEHRPGGQDWARRRADLAFAREFTAGMDARGRFLELRLAEAIADLRARRVLDIGAARGIYLCALVDRFPGLRGAVFERPPIDRAARSLLDERGYADRIEVATGDIFTDPLPGGYDLHLVSHVLHDWDEFRVRRLLAGCFAALAPGVSLVDHDVHINAGQDRAPPGGGVFRVPHALHTGPPSTSSLTARSSVRPHWVSLERRSTSMAARYRRPKSQPAYF